VKILITSGSTIDFGQQKVVEINNLNTEAAIRLFEKLTGDIEK
jgi:hypothetical protein